MIISKGRAYVFVHIPKTGGTSLALALENRAMKDDLLIGDTPKARRRRCRLKDLPARGRLWKHATLADIDGILTPQELSGMFTFTLVRNPWDRVVSYYHWLKDQQFDHPSVGIAKRLPFDGFLADLSIQESLRRYPASAYMRDVTGKERCRSYIRLERLETDLARLHDHLGFALKIPHENRSQRDVDYRQYYTRPLQDIVNRICAEDIARFGYGFDDIG